MDQHPQSIYEESWVPGGEDLLRFYTRIYLARNPLAALIFVHGFTEHISRAVSVALPLTHYGGANMLALEELGGSLLLHLATSSSLPSYVQESIGMLSGIIASSPFLAQTEPLAKSLRHIVAIASKALPAILISTELPHSYLSRNRDVVATLAKDPLVKQKSSMKFVTEMLDAGEHLIQLEHPSVPCGLSVLVLHGTADRITSFTASKQFFDCLDARDKTFVDIQDAYHELVHEPYGVREEYMDRCIDWVLSRAASYHQH
ncbi:hypothetical protein ONZ51_g5957 [Trametes cubensis]|uniref:Serine aminopeptidase S33 domain-containing protein n=1 Tax=Trametes cubensis TaxID=1111947 RepID=A0AAD7TU47_9APHY|nr:hypothetical protein ONZ51_g5957 [Trametes cubensis]